MTAFTLKQEMLALSLIAYQGISETGPDRHGDQRIDQKIQAALQDWAPVRGRYERIWGPARWRFPVDLFDSCSMLALRDLQRPERVVVVIRGTNPICLLDWVLGDLLVHRTTPWTWGSAPAGASISWSDSLGLSLLRRLRAEPVTPDLVEPLELAPAETPSPTQTPADPEALIRARTELEALLETREPPSCSPARPDSSSRWSRFASLPYELLDGIFERAEAALGGVDPWDSAFYFRTQGIDTSDNSSRGITLCQLLTRARAREVIVTGHSKGGALASTLGLYLAELERPARTWSPSRVRVWSFAAPTAGNRAFAEHSDRVIGPRCHRIANLRDIVTLAWNTELLARVPEEYPLSVALHPLASGIGRAIRSLDYQHQGGKVHSFRGSLGELPAELAIQAVRQHLQAYIEEAGLEEHIDLPRVLGLQD